MRYNLIGMDETAANSRAWDHEVETGSAWARIASEEEIASARNGAPGIRVTVEKNVPHSWIGGLKGKHVLSLAGGGGQQTPLLAAFGCRTECLDASRRMLERDKEALERYGLEAELHLGSMTDLSIFPSSSFDSVINPVSLNFVSDISAVYRDVHRILVPGGTFIMGIANPALYLFDDRMLAKGKMRIKYTLPFSDVKSLSAKELGKRLAKGDTIEFSHTLESVLGTLTGTGFAITGFFSDGTSFEPVDSFLHDCYLAIRAERR